MITWRNGEIVAFSHLCFTLLQLVEMREAMYCAITIALPLAKALHP